MLLLLDARMRQHLIFGLSRVSGSKIVILKSGGAEV